MDVLWVTSFARDMYEVSGRSLIESFVRRRPSGQLLVCREGLEELPTWPRVLHYDLDTDAWLKSWLEKNKPFIPPMLGGTAPPCKCPGGPLGPHDKRHNLPCPGYWFCKNASRWFRKIVCLRHAMTLNPRRILWVDSDCQFAKTVTNVHLDQWFRNASVFYFCNRRPVLEAGLVGYDMSRDGRKVIEKMIEIYESGSYATLKRWDDCYVLQKAMRFLSPAVKTIDLATKVGEHAQVIPHSPVGPFLHHSKGRHGRGLKIME